MKKYIQSAFLALPFALALTACEVHKDTSADGVQRAQQEQIQQEIVSSVGMPAVQKFARKRLLKQVIEMCDTETPTYTYVVAEQTGKFVYVGKSFGFGIPAAAQYTNPQKYQWVDRGGAGWVLVTLPQADPDGLFSPASADGTWIMMLNPETNKAEPQYMESRINVFTFKLQQ